MVVNTQKNSDFILVGLFRFVVSFCQSQKPSVFGEHEIVGDYPNGHFYAGIYKLFGMNE